MPRLIDGQLPNEGKFKKRRAWLTTDDPIPALPAVIAKPEISARKDTPEARTQVKSKQDYNKTVTRVEQEHNKALPSKAHGTFFDFLDAKRASLFNFESHDPKASLVILSELQRQIFWHVAKQCLNRNVHHTGPIEIKSFFNELDTSTAIVRTTLNRLREKRLIQREQGKLGRNGFAILSLPSLIYDAAKEILAEYQPQ